MTLPATLRRLEPGDTNYVLSTWLRSYWAHNEHLHWIGQRIFAGHWHAVVEPLVTEQRVTVACNPTAPEQIYGWVCAQRSALHYVYVKDVYRGNGLSRRLVAARGSPTECTFWSQLAEAIAPRYGWLYTPGRLSYWRDHGDRAQARRPARTDPDPRQGSDAVGPGESGGAGEVSGVAGVAR